jgi:hypothetical protein
VTKKDFEVIADILVGDLACTQRNSVAWYKIKSITDSLADYFGKVNPKFDRQKFYERVGTR